ncbi:hypothetical protein [Halobacillus litoralis]|uniref:Uncharacterized protein n=1 Tax=Halobacillus litoralis TaxID=45668 RepID=A0A410MJI6_9BACI|nr:hypothetical protein [Halobacillus litoralis]QAS54860.1 hypothetical protein HLI_21655 [Halobacillus litoralis]
MLLKEEGIEDFIADIKESELNIETLSLKFNPEKSYALINALGTSSIMQNEEYYENVEENVFATEFSWFGPLCQELNSLITANMRVDTEGNFDQEKVMLEVNVVMPRKISSLYKELKPLVLFHPYITSMKVKGGKGRIRNIFFYLELDAKMVNKTINHKENINHQILTQWIYGLEVCERDNRSKKVFDNRFKVVNGKMNRTVKKEMVSQYFNHNDDK